MGYAAYAVLAAEIGFVIAGIYAIHAKDEVDTMREKLINQQSKIMSNPNLTADEKKMLSDTVVDSLTQLAKQQKKIEQEFEKNVLVKIGRFLGL